ncbi:ATP-binding protein [Methylobacterium goesingense]|uniref:Signal transduction histidine kinase n=1 Tax=Methylobacterium goesingense TaxID=243690 RepID=A0ABV2LBX8_9HYPH|nr:hypothetical protein [Methylobacterium goesingense]GJD73589.1 hypothetical protein CFIICLFH_1818 [Methylobacterium goesingense]
MRAFCSLPVPSDTGGTGLSQTIARRIVKAEGGTIAVVNRPEGGLQVRISLPRAGR